MAGELIMRNEISTVKWTCDNCGKSITLNTADKEKLPPGWKLLAGKDICVTCSSKAEEARRSD